MSDVSDFLAQLSDNELAFLVRYRKDSYLPASQQFIEVEVQKRNLSEVQIDEIIKAVSFDRGNDGCPRCNSKRRLANGDCAICSWNDEDEEERTTPLGKKILKLGLAVLSLFGGNAPYLKDNKRLRY
jgi:hypothetical protein